MKSIPLILPLMALPISGQAEKRGNVEMPQCPNVVFIYADDIGYGDLSCNGSKTINTPNVQRCLPRECDLLTLIVLRLPAHLPVMRC